MIVYLEDMNKDLKLNKLSSEELLSLRFKDLKLYIKNSTLERRLNLLRGELEAKGLNFKPHIWISDEWFTPDDIAGFAVPFYLVHPRLLKLEKEQMFEAEGEDKKECMRILRHETGHAISHAYQLYHRKDWRKVFGDFKKPYPLWYVPDISTKNFVTHLNAWYAQAHPLEDFAETFAVWLNPSSEWRRIYKRWPAIQKLEYLERLMEQLKDQKPLISGRDEYAPVSRLKKTLMDHYIRKKKFYSAEWPESFDIELKKIFKDGKGENEEDAPAFIKMRRKALRSSISSILNIPPYTVDQIILQMIRRTKQLGLSRRKDESTERKILIVLTSQLINTLQSGYHRIPL